MADDAAVTFTDTFYKLIFQDNMEICLAFELARNNVGIKHGSEEERKFLLLVYDPTNNCINHRYSVGLHNVPTKQSYSNHNCRKLLS